MLRGRCLPYGTGITYWPLLELLQADLGVTLTDSRSDLIARLEARLEELLPNARARAPIRARLGVLLGIDEASAALPDVPPTRRSAELGAGLGAYLEGIAAGGPLVVVVDDLQWADPSVLEIMPRAPRSRSSTCRSSWSASPGRSCWNASPAGDPGVANSTTIVLEPLNADETRTLIARLLDIDDLPEALRAAVVARSEGNPLFCEEFVRMLIEEGRLVRDGDRWRAADPRQPRRPRSRSRSTRSSPRASTRLSPPRRRCSTPRASSARNSSSSRSPAARSATGSGSARP